VNCYRIHQKSLNFIYPFKLYSNFTNKNVSWLHFSWATQYTIKLGQSWALWSNPPTPSFAMDRRLIVSSFHREQRKRQRPAETLIHTRDIFELFSFLPRDAMRKRRTSCRPVSVCLSVTLVSCIQMAKLKMSSNFFFGQLAPSF